MSIRRARAPFAALAAAAILAGLIAAPFNLAQPNPSGSGVTAAALDVRLVRTETYGPHSFQDVSYVVATSNASATPGGNPLYGATYDLTFTNITVDATQGGYGYGYSGTTTGLRLCAPGDGSPPNPRDLYPDGQHPGRYNVTFPSTLLNDTGAWRLLSGASGSAPCPTSGALVASFFVRPVADLAVSVSPSVVASGAGSVSYTVTVSNAGGAPVRLSGPNIPQGTVTGPSGQHVATGPRPAPGTYAITAELDATGGPIPERTGGATLTVVSTPVARIVAPTLSGGALHPATGALRLENVTSLGSLTLNLSFDPSVVEIKSVTNGTVPGSRLTWSVNNSTGTLRLLVTNPARPGPTGSFVVANVSFQAKLALGATSALHLDAIELADSDGAAIPHVTVDGRFRAGLLGDVNADSAVNQADLAALSQCVVGFLPASSIALANADTSADGQVTGVDALFLSQHLAGTRPTLG